MLLSSSLYLRGVSGVMSATTQVNLLAYIGDPGWTLAHALFTFWIWSLLRYHYKLTATIYLKLHALISKCFSKSYIVATIYLNKWNFAKWLGKKLSRQCEQYILVFEVGERLVC